MKPKFKSLILSIALLTTMLSCEPAVENLVGPSVSGYTVAASAFYGGAGLIVNSAGQATIRVEVFKGGKPVNGAAITLTATLGTLGATALTTVNGVATTTLTPGAIVGLSSVTATVENASATTSVPILAF